MICLNPATEANLSINIIRKACAGQTNQIYCTLALILSKPDEKRAQLSMVECVSPDRCSLILFTALRLN